MITSNVFSSLINLYLPEPHASLLNGMIFGIPLRSARIFYLQLRTVGLLHVVVLSGMNITILAHLIGILTQSCGKKISLWITIFVIILFVLFVGPQPPIVRAACMGTLSYFAILTGRQYVGFFGLFLSTLFIAVFFPQWISTLSFHLSVGATLGILLFGSVKKQKSASPLRQLVFYLYENFRISFAAQLFTTPLIFFTFKQISLVSLLSNILISWTITPLMILGICTSVLGTINYNLGLPSAYLSYGLLTYFILIVELLPQIPFALIQL